MAADEEYVVPLQDQRVFGAGLKRKRVQFVPSGSSAPSVQPSRAHDEHHGHSIGDYYLSLVLPDSKRNPQAISPVVSAHQEQMNRPLTTLPRCDVCHLPLDSDAASETIVPSPPTTTTTPAHEASLAHQVCLTHSHPPSHLDRHRKGIQYLSSYGWDPDSRLGLGVAGEGIRAPIKGKVKRDTLGIGMKLPEKEVGVRPKKVERLDAKGVRRKEADLRKRGQKLQDLFYASEDLEKYLKASK
ncbi:MAG: hypothetical protein M1817_005289 [Caeruleum heppii]|nr:MAG: hypothetical protein M1817_005289 [Caeruleum heppii]